MRVRKGDEEWSFDPAKALRDAASAGAPSCIAYMAFYRGVKQEVSIVTSGYQVSVRYDMCFVAGAGSSSHSVIASSIPPRPLALSHTELPFESKLKGLLDNAEFLPDGGFVGFHLLHEYPSDMVLSLKSLTKRLKGRDATVVRVCENLGLPVSPKAVYSFRENYMHIMIDKDVHFRKYCDSMAWRTLVNEGGRVIQVGWDDDEDASSEDYPDQDDVVYWDTPRTACNEIKTTYRTEMAYFAGGRPMDAVDWSVTRRLALIVEIGPAGKRTEGYRTPEDLDEPIVSPPSSPSTTPTSNFASSDPPVFEFSFSPDTFSTHSQPPPPGASSTTAPATLADSTPKFSFGFGNGGGNPSAGNTATAFGGTTFVSEEHGFGGSSNTAGASASNTAINSNAFGGAKTTFVSGSVFASGGGVPKQGEAPEPLFGFSSGAEWSGSIFGPKPGGSSPFSFSTPPASANAQGGDNVTPQNLFLNPSGLAFRLAVPHKMDLSARPMVRRHLFSVK
jgi:hypothetical protein